MKITILPDPEDLMQIFHEQNKMVHKENHRRWHSRRLLCEDSKEFHPDKM